ncbi:unnamed protein product, partial [marine sediment metagenome]
MMKKLLVLVAFLAMVAGVFAAHYPYGGAYGALEYSNSDYYISYRSYGPGMYGYSDCIEIHASSGFGYGCYSDYGAGG